MIRKTKVKFITPYLTKTDESVEAVGNEQKNILNFSP